MNLHHRLKLAGRALLVLLNPQKDFMPTDGYEVAHDLGRWWDAVLRLEDTVDFVIPAELEEASQHNLRLLTDNPARLLMNNPDVPWLREHSKINPHNFRESLLAFGALLNHRQNPWACEAALQLVGAMDDALGDDGSFDPTKLKSWGDIPLTNDLSHTEQKREGWFDSTATSGRALEALVGLFESTYEPAVLDLARRIAQHHLKHSINRDGTMRSKIVDPNNVGHNHSYHGTLRGLLLFGLLTDDKEYVEVVAATYRNGVRNRIVFESGWAPHDLGKLRFPTSHGDPVNDPASSGDSAQLALWLALHAGCDDLLDDVERLVRARLIPSQLTEEDVRRNPDRTFPSRDIGAWGIYDHCHAGKRCIPDVTAAVVHTLCNIYSHIYTLTEHDISVNLHFDKDDDYLTITSTREQRAKLSIRIKQVRAIKIRIPGWAPQSTATITVDGKELPLKLEGVFACISETTLRQDSEIILSYDLPEKTTEERMPSGRSYRFQWRGDEIIGVTPQEGPLPFYPAMPA